MSGDFVSKVHMVDGGYWTFDWMVYKEDLENQNCANLAHVMFVDIHIASMMLGIEIGEIEEQVDKLNSNRDPDFPLPVVRRGKQVRWILKSLIQYIEKQAESRCRHRYDKALEELRSFKGGA